MKLEILVISLIILLIYGDENATTTTPAPSTSSSSTSAATSSSTSQVSTTTQVITSTTSAPNVENSTKPVKPPSNRTQLLNTSSYACSCDLTVISSCFSEKNIFRRDLIYSWIATLIAVAILTVLMEFFKLSAVTTAWKSTIIIMVKVWSDVKSTMDCFAYFEIVLDRRIIM